MEITISNLSLLEKLLDFVTRFPNLPASKIAKSLKVTRHEINSLLYKNINKKFTRIDHGESAPTWMILNPNSISKLKEVKNDFSQKDKNENSAIENIFKKISINLDTKELLHAQAGSLKFEILLVSEGINSPYTRYEIMEKNELLIIVNTDSTVINLNKDINEINIYLHIYHCIADCLTEFTILRTKVIEEEFIVIKQKFMRDLQSMKIFL